MKSGECTSLKSVAISGSALIDLRVESVQVILDIGALNACTICEHEAATFIGISAGGVVVDALK
jgi:hypothetical protein